MSKLTVKVYHLGTCREFFFTGSGPYTVGGAGADILLPELSAPALQFKLSAGKIFLHRLCDAVVGLDHRQLPLRSEVEVGSGTSVEVQGHQLILSLEATEAELPPPFTAEEFKAHYEELAKRISAQQANLKGLGSELTQKEKQIAGVAGRLLELRRDQHQLELTIDKLKIEKRAVDGELTRQREQRKIEDEKLRALSEELGCLATERSGIQQHIHKLQLDLRQFKTTHEEKNQELQAQRRVLESVVEEIQEAKKMLTEIHADASDKHGQVLRDQERLEAFLREAQAAVEEKHRINHQILELQQQRAQLQAELDDLGGERGVRAQSIRDAQTQLEAFKRQVEREEEKLRGLKQAICAKVDEEARLKSAQEVIRLESQKLEAEFSRRRGQYAALEADHKKATNELAQLDYKAHDCQQRIARLVEDEHKQQFRLLALRKEADATEARLELEGKKQQAQFADEQQRLLRELVDLREKLEARRLEGDELDLKIKHGKDEFEKWHKALTGLKLEKAEVEQQLAGLKGQRQSIEHAILGLRSELEDCQHLKVQREHEVTDLQFKLSETRSQLRQVEEASALELQQRKREFEQRLVVDRELLLAEIELVKKKTLNEVEEEKRLKLEDLQREKLEAQRRSEALVHDAHREADRLLVEARERLKAASLEAQEREAKAHQRFLEAQELYHLKQEEAEELLRRAEATLQTDFAERKSQMKAYLTKKQNKTIAGLAHLTDQHLQKLARVEARAFAKIDAVKRKELKKVSELRATEMGKHQELRDAFALEMREERKRVLQQLRKVREEQERELADAKKLALQNLNQSKQKTLEEARAEIQREKEQFENSKEQRLVTATRSVVKLLSSQLALPEGLEAQVKTSLQQALNGKFSVTTQTGEKILDFNPLKQKAVLPVLRKYALRFGVPAAAALVLGLDVGGVRTRSLDLAKTALQQKESAAEKFVQQQKQEWKEKNTFTPPTTPEYKASYVDNVLYTTDFLSVVEQEAFQNEWILKLHDFITRDLELSEDVAIGYISSEGALLKELSLARADIHPSFKDQGIRKMQDSEAAHLGWLATKVTPEPKLQRLYEFRRNFYQDYYRQNVQAKRSTASEPAMKP